MKRSIALFTTAIAFALMALIVVQVLSSTSSRKPSADKGFQYASLISLDSYKEAAYNLLGYITDKINRGLQGISETPAERRWEKQQEGKASSHTNLKVIAPNKDIEENDEELEYQGKHETTNNPSEMVHEEFEKKWRFYLHE